MTWPDTINGVFELLGGLVIMISVAKLARDKHVAGVSWIHMAFFTAWGWWNLIYYAELGQRLSWLGGLLLVVANSVYLVQLLYYSGRPIAHDQRRWSLEIDRLSHVLRRYDRCRCGWPRHMHEPHEMREHPIFCYGFQLVQPADPLETIIEDDR